jgi:hypothetical protein
VNIRLGNLAVGQYRELTPEEERQLRKKLGENSRTEAKAKDKKRTIKKDADIRRKG